MDMIRLPKVPTELTPIQTLVAVSLVAVCALNLLNGRRRKVHGLRSIPGPVPLPIVGNMLSIDSKQPWMTYAKWGARYGNIFAVRVLKLNIIVVNSRKIARDLLDGRANVYSDRPDICTVKPFGWSFHLAWARYGEHWRSQRRIFNQVFRAEATPTYHPIQLKKSRELILDVLGAPRDFCEHLQRYAAAAIMAIVYDYNVSPGHDHFVDLFEHGSVLAFKNITPEASSIVAAFPFMLSLPEWFPGAVLSRKAAESTRCAVRMLAEPFEHAKRREEMGSTAPAMAVDFLRNRKDSLEDPAELQLLKDTCATAFIAGAETVASTLKCFMLAMLQNPHVQERAQAEIDRVVGKNRLPNFDDRPNLPYIDAVLLETLRMYVIVPLGFPHATTADDIYEDMFIPKGSIIVPNAWAICHDEDIYPEPGVFKPERFLVDGKPNGEKFTESLAFGFGRRLCPGRHNAEESIWAAVVSMLSAFKITKAVGKDGKAVEFEPTFSLGVTSTVNPFPCSITPRLANVDIRKLATADPLQS